MSYLDQVIPEPRLRRYQALAGGDDTQAEAFYLWAQGLSSALFADVATTEVVLRSAMARELNRVFGDEWYARPDLFDDETARDLTSAWSKVKALSANPAVPKEVVEGKLIVSLMFGFWVRLLGTGGRVGRAPTGRPREYYELLWQPALQAAFPGVSRKDVSRSAERVRYVRNRIAHHEHIAWGIAIPSEGSLVLTVLGAHEELLRLAGFVDATATTWITEHSTVSEVIDACPSFIAVDQLKLS